MRSCVGRIKLPVLVGVLIGIMALQQCRPLMAEDVVTQPIRTFGLGTLQAVAYSPDGRHFATCGGRGAFVWDIDTGTVIRMFTGHADGVSSVAFSPDGTKVLTGSDDGTAKLWASA